MSLLSGHIGLSVVNNTTIVGTTEAYLQAGKHYDQFEAGTGTETPIDHQNHKASPSSSFLSLPQHLLETPDVRKLQENSGTILL